MIRTVVLLVALSLIVGCAKSAGTFGFELEPGCTITVSSVKVSKPERRVNGVLKIVNNGKTFVKISNQELFLICGKDTARAYVARTGKWELDKGLINVVSGKTILTPIFWPLMPNGADYTLQVKYIKHLDRNAPPPEEEETEEEE